MENKKLINIDSIKGLINKEALQDSINKNQDSYGFACVKVAINTMKYLDDFKEDFNIGYSPDMTTTHGIMCKCDDEGITGFMAGAARNIIATCHALGWKYYLADLLNKYNIDKKEDVDKYINNVVNAKLTDFETAKEYTDSLIMRYKTNETNQ